jgi:hypothetical protein
LRWGRRGTSPSFARGSPLDWDSNFMTIVGRPGSPRDSRNHL